MVPAVAGGMVGMLMSRMKVMGSGTVAGEISSSAHAQKKVKPAMPTHCVSARNFIYIPLMIFRRTQCDMALEQGLLRESAS